MPKTIRIAASFSRHSKKIIKRTPELNESIKKTISKLIVNPFDQTLHTHPLKGKLKGKYACSLTSDLRIIFRLVDDTLYLLEIGTHDEVY
jgi:addiction module RelE/StbE family toxin